MTTIALTASDTGARRTLPVGVVGLLAAAMLLNYVDRGSLSIVAPSLGRRFGIDSVRMGLLLSAFFWTYAAAQPVAGWLAQRFDVKRVLAAGVALWAAATTLSGLASGFAALFVLRLLLGIGESVLIPSNACLFARSLPPHWRGRANGVMSVAISMGPSLGAVVAGALLVSLGWRSVFLILGAVTFLWLVPWLRLDSGAAQLRSDPRPPPAYRQILRRRSFWGVSLGQFCYSYPAYLLLTWLPLFLVRTEHLSMGATTLIVALSYLGNGVVSWILAAMSDTRIARGAELSGVYKSCLATGLCLGGAAMLAAGLTGGAFAIACLVVYSLSCGICHPFLFAIGQALSGPQCGGRWMGLQNMVGNLAGIAAPIATGVVVQVTGSFSAAFIAAAALCFVGAVFYVLVVPRIAPVAWDQGR